MFAMTRPRPPNTYPTTSFVRSLYVPAQLTALTHAFLTDRIKSYAPTPEKPFVLGLPTGSSPEAIYKNLVKAHKNGEISFRNVVTFNMVRKSNEKSHMVDSLTQFTG